MPSAPIDLVVFDVAGTTIRDGGQVAEAFERTLAAQGIAMDPEELRPWRGASKRRALQHFLEKDKEGAGPPAPERLDRVYAKFCEQLKMQFERRGVQPIPGARETFAWLRSRGVRVALTTGFDRDVASLLLHAAGWDEGTLDAVVSGEDVPLGRPAPYMIFRAMESTGVVSVHRVINVGDTALDLESGWNAGVHGNLGVLSGAHAEAQLRPVPHTHLIPSVAELPGLLVVEGDRVSLPA